MARPSATRWRWPPDSCFGSRSRAARAEDLAGLGDEPVHLGPRRLPHAQAELEVLADRHVRVERVALEDHRDVALARRDAVDGRPPIAISPSVASSSPAISRRAVDLPQPEARRAP
jgi:hypothetical protein